MKKPLHYIEYGEPSSTKTLVVLHGLFGSAKNLAGICRFVEPHCRVLAFDLPNHGQSPHRARCTIDEMATDILDQAVLADLPAFSVLGHSLGGKVAMAMALRAPEKVEKLVVADIAPVQYSPSHQRILEGMRTLPENTQSRLEATKHMEQFVDDAQVIQFLLHSLYRQGDYYRWRINVKGIADSYADLLKGLTPDDYPVAFARPVLFIKGEHSDYILKAYEPAITALFENWQLAEVASAGHWLHAENPLEFNNIVGGFLL